MVRCVVYHVFFFYRFCVSDGSVRSGSWWRQRLFAIILFRLVQGDAQAQLIATGYRIANLRRRSLPPTCSLEHFYSSLQLWRFVGFFRLTIWRFDACRSICRWSLLCQRCLIKWRCQRRCNGAPCTLASGCYRLAVLTCTASQSPLRVDLWLWRPLHRLLPGRAVARATQWRNRNNNKLVGQRLLPPANLATTKAHKCRRAVQGFQIVGADVRHGCALRGQRKQQQQPDNI